MRKSLICLSIAIFLNFSSLALSQTLQEAVQQTLATNPDVWIHAHQYGQIQQELRQSKAAFLPKVDLTAASGPQRAKNSSTTQEYETALLKRAELNINENVFNGFSDYYAIKGNHARLLSSAWLVTNTAQNLALNAAIAYLSVLRDQQLVAISKKNIFVHQKYLKMIHRRSEQGIGNKSDVSTVKGRLALATTNELSDENSYLDSLITYRQVVGTQPKNLSLPRDLNLYLPANLETAEQIALIRHPALAASRANFDARHWEYRATNGKFYPAFDVVVRTNRSQDIEGVREDNFADEALLQMRYNLYRGGFDLAEKHRVAAQKQEALQEIRQRSREVLKSLGFAWDAYQISKRKIRYLQLHQVESKDTVTAYAKQFTLDKRTLIDLLNAESEYFNAARTHVTGQYDLIINKLRVLNGMGILLSSLQVRIPQTKSQTNPKQHHAL